LHKRINNNTLSENQSLYKQYASNYKGSGMKKAANVSPETTSSTSIGNIGNSAKEAKRKYKEQGG
jgi:hypothetical protein